MKRLLAAGLGNIYQIAAVFRDHDFSAVHRPEFRLLEWYRVDAPWTALMADCESLLREVVHALCEQATGDASADRRPGDLAAPFARISVDTAFIRHAGFSILDNLDPTALMLRLRERDIHVGAHDSWADLFFRIFLQVVEPALVSLSAPFFLTHFPAPLAASAKLCAHDARCAERFELYVRGLELANGMGELTCATTQGARFDEECRLRVAAGKRDYPRNESFFTSLATMPPCSGIALGLDRLVMVMLGASDLDAVSAIPWAQA